MRLSRGKGGAVSHVCVMRNSHAELLEKIVFSNFAVPHILVATKEMFFGGSTRVQKRESPSPRGSLIRYTYTYISCVLRPSSSEGERQGEQKLEGWNAGLPNDK